MKMIYDPLRKKDIVVTPEELVRQKIIQWLLKVINIPPQWLLCEYKINGKWAVDLLAQYTVEGELKNILLVETKAPEVQIDGYVFAQAERYMQILNPKFVCLSNGNEFFFFQKQKNGYEQIDELPIWQVMLKK